MADVQKDKPLPFYQPNIGPHLKPQTRSLFESYSGIASEDVEAHLHSIRNRAWSLQKYPCIGQWMFLLPRMPSLPCYPLILDRVKKGASILDVGCCFGQDLRFLTADGAPTREMYATDIVPDFWDLGYDLFRDKERFHAWFIAADILDPESSSLRELQGRIDICLVNQVFHLFSREKQFTMAKHLISMSRPGSCIVGWHVGSNQGKALPISTQTGGPDGSAGSETRLFHNHMSWRELWQEVGHTTGTQWEVETWMQSLQEWGYEKEDTAWMGPGAMGFEFICRRTDGTAASARI